MELCDGTICWPFDFKIAVPEKVRLVVIVVVKYQTGSSMLVHQMRFK
jgi:hypothetical protein